MELTPPPKGLGGFTLAEVLITLTIIGIVAAITLPSLLVNVNDKAWNAQRKALYARMSQAIGEMDSVAGYGTNDGEITDKNDTTIKSSSAESFIIDGLSKVYRVQNVCNKNNLTACGLPDEILTMQGNAVKFPKTLYEMYNNKNNQVPDTDVAAFETVNGESIAVYYNPFCESHANIDNYYTARIACANMVYDLNGLKGPNETGKDIGFMTVFYRTNSVVTAPNPFPSDAGSSLKSYSDDGNDAASACIKQGDNARIPDKDELASMYLNNKITGPYSPYYWSGSVITPGETGTAWHVNFNVGYRYIRSRTKESYSVRCVKR